MKTLLLSLALILVPVTTVADTTGCLDPVTAASVDPGVAVITPAGTMDALANQGVVVEVFVGNCDAIPVPGFPYQDVWLDDVGNGEISLCQGGSTADGPTNAEGLTWISGRISGGGFTTQGTLVYVAGLSVEPQNPLPLQLISPDYDADLTVGVIDFGEFGLDFGRWDRPRSDFDGDGVVGIADFATFGTHFGDVCP